MAQPPPAAATAEPAAAEPAAAEPAAAEPAAAEPATAEPPLEREVWLACAGPFSRIPAVGSLVYYFPRGHADQCRGAAGAHLAAPLPDDAVPCKVTAVQLLYHDTTDDPHAVITLHPDPDQRALDDVVEANPTETTAAAYFVKEFSSNRTSHTNPFGVPKACCEALFPRHEPNTRIMDVHGKQMEFAHRIYKNKHVLSPKWKDYFVARALNQQDDAVVVMRRAGGGFVIGPRRGAPSTDLAQKLVEDVVQAAASATGEMPFTVIYYPRQGWEFVVPRKEVHDAEARNWQPGVKVTMTSPVDYHELGTSRARNDVPRIYNGFVRSVKNTNWCKLEIQWGGSGESTPRRDVNVWQVQYMGDPSPEKQRKLTSHDAAAASSHRLELVAGRPTFEESDAVPPQSITMPGVASSSMAGSPAARVQEGSHGGLHGEPSSSSTSSFRLFGVQITPETDGQPGKNIDEKNKST